MFWRQSPGSPDNWIYNLKLILAFEYAVQTVCVTQLPSQSIFSQDSELTVFEQKLKSDSVNPQPITFSDFFFIKVDPNIKLAWV